MAQLLLLGSERVRAAGIRSLLRQDGHSVAWVRSVGEWNASEREVHPEIVIVADSSPEKALCSAGESQRGFLSPILLVQQEGDFRRDPYLQQRLVDRISSPFMGEEFLARVDALIRVRRVICRDPSAPRSAPGTERPEGIGGHLASWLRSRLPVEKPIMPYLEVAARVADWADRRDAFEPGHAERVTSFCSMIAEVLQMDPDDTEDLLRAAMLHDIGKVGLPYEVLHQTKPLEDSQKRLIRTHPAKGAALLRALDPDEKVARVVLYHHERPDGAGYYGKQEGVPLAAAVLAVAEAYDAMTSSKVRETLDPKQALRYLDSVKGEAYDSDCVEALIDSLRPRTNAIPLSPIR